MSIIHLRPTRKGLYTSESLGKKVGNYILFCALIVWSFFTGICSVFKK